MDTHYEYNELGQLVDKKLHWDSTLNKYLQSVDYRYNIRGWLTSINDPALSNSSINDDSMTNGDKFGMTLGYQTGTGAQYNGNIRGITWGTTRKGIASYSFVYDKLNRLKEAVSGNNMYNENIGYSNMGNITKLGRWANIGGSRIQIDSLTYSYSANQLRDVVDQVTGTYGYVDNGISDINDIRYDANGNISKDLNRGITDYNYTYLNLPGLITFSNGTELDFDYERQSGKKVKKRFVNGTTITTTDYVDGIQYETVTGNSPQLSLIQTDEGRIRKNGTDYVYEYDLKDHLGNVRVTVQPSADSAKVVQENSYYAFGMDMPGMGFVVGTGNQYLYNGKEKQEELFGQYDYGARFYDPVIGRWNVPDPLAEIYDDLSPYNYTFNNPVRFVDPDGTSVADSVKKTESKPILLNEVTVTGRRVAKAAGIILLGTAARTGTAWGITAGDPEPVTKTILGVATAAYSLYVIGNEIYKYNKAVVKSEKTVDDLKKEGKSAGKPTGTGTEIIDREGGMQQADKDFNDIVEPGSVKPNPSIPGARIGKTPDGKTVNVRNKSLDGRPTVEVYNPNTRTKETKFRYN